MRRRALLASLGALPAGCVGAPGSRTANRSSSSESSDASHQTVTPTCDSRPRTTPRTRERATEAAAEYELSDLDVSTSVDRPSVRYVLEPSAFYSADAVDREEEQSGEELTVRDIADVEDKTVRDVIETAITSGAWRSDTLPDGLVETLEEVDFFTGVQGKGDTHTGLSLYRFQPDEPPAIEFDATLVDGIVSQESPGAIELSLTNRSSSARTVSAGTVPPFGTVFAESAKDDGKFLLWREYEDEGCVDFTQDGVYVCSIGKIVELSPCGTISRQYDVLPSTTSNQPEYTVPPGSGTYRITDRISYTRVHGAPESRLDFEVEFTLESSE